MIDTLSEALDKQEELKSELLERLVKVAQYGSESDTVRLLCDASK